MPLLLSLLYYGMCVRLSILHWLCSRKNSKKMAFKCQFTFMYTTKTASVGETGLHIYVYVERKPWQIAHRIRMCVCMQFGKIGWSKCRYYDSSQSTLLLKGAACTIYIHAVHIQSIIHPLGPFCVSSLLYAFHTDGRFLLSENHIASPIVHTHIDASRRPAIVRLRHMQFVLHLALLNLYAVLCFFLGSFSLGTYWYYCLQSHPNSLSTHDVHNATLEQWHLDTSKSLER